MVDLDSTEPFLSILQLDSLKFSVALLKDPIYLPDIDDSLQDVFNSNCDNF